MIRGLVGSPAKLGVQEHLMVDAVRERLFEFVTKLAQDLASLNMQRGRDHGIPGSYPLNASPFHACCLFACLIQFTFIEPCIFKSDCQGGSGLTQYN